MFTPILCIIYVIRPKEVATRESDNRIVSVGTRLEICIVMIGPIRGLSRVDTSMVSPTSLSDGFASIKGQPGPFGWF